MLLLLFACVDKAPGQDTADVSEDSGCDPVTYYADLDGDGFGNADAPLEACSAPSGHVLDATDCDDGDAAVHPDATEVCNGIDDDCDGEVDPNGLADGDPVFADADGDGYGDPDQGTTVCQETEGYVADSSDCDDSSADANPGGDEVCDDVDNDCDGVVDWGQRVPSDHADLSTAIDATGDGGIICVEAGTYTESFSLDGRALTIRSSQGAGSTVFDVGETTPMVSIGGGSDVAFQGFAVTNVSSAERGGFAVVEDATAAFTDVVFEANAIELAGEQGLSGALIWAGGSTLVVDGLVVRELQVEIDADAYLDVDGGVVYASSSDVTLSDVEVEDASVMSLAAAENLDVYGLVLGFEETSFDVDGLTARDLVASLETWDAIDLEGLALYADYDSTGSVERVDITGTQASITSEGSAYLRGVVTLSGGGRMEGVEMHDNVGSASSSSSSTYVNGATLSALSHLELSHASFTGNEAWAVPTGGSSGYAYGAAANLTGGADVDHVDARGNLTVGAAYAQGGAITISAAEDRPSSLSQFVIAGNVAGDGSTRNALGGGVYLSGWDQPVAVVNGDVFGNEVHGELAKGAGIHFLNGNADVESSTYTNVSISSNTLTAVSEAGGTAFHFEDYGRGGTPPLLTYCNVYDQAADAFAGIPDLTGVDGNIGVDPGYVDVSGVDSAAWDLTLAAGSGLIDAGDPSITDGDGTTSDIGAYGGAADW